MPASYRYYPFDACRVGIQAASGTNPPVNVLRVKDVKIRIFGASEETTGSGEPSSYELANLDWEISFSTIKKRGQNFNATNYNLIPGTVIWFYHYPDKTDLTKFGKYPCLVEEVEESNGQKKLGEYSIKLKAHGETGSPVHPEAT